MSSLKRRYVDPPELSWQDPMCGDCCVTCIGLDGGWWGCPECGTQWDNYGNPNEFEEWIEDNDPDILPPLMDGFCTIREDSKVTIVEVDNPPNSFTRFLVMIDDHRYCNSSEYLYAEQEADELRAKIKAHYTLRKEDVKQ